MGTGHDSYFGTYGWDQSISTLETRIAVVKFSCTSTEILTGLTVPMIRELRLVLQYLN